MSRRPFAACAAALISLLIGTAAAAPTAGVHPGPSVRRLVVKPAPSRPRENAATSAPTPAHRQPARHAHRVDSARDRRLERQLLVIERRAQARELAAVAARRDRRYALARTNAPILSDTRACKRLGVHGESIWENCTLVGDGAATR